MKFWTARALAISLSSVFVLCAAQGAWAQRTENLIFYSSLTTAAQTTLVNAIEKKFPGIKVTWVTANGYGLYQRFVADRMAGKGKIDLLYAGFTPGWYHFAREKWVRPGVAEFPEAADYPDWAKDAKAHWVSLRAATLQVVYNADTVKRSDVPTSWREFTEPKWKGRLVLADPFRSAGLWDFFYGSEDFGEEYIKDLVANGALVRSRMGAAADQVAAGERDITFVFEHFAIRRIAEGARLKFAKMKEGTPVIPATFGIVKDGPNPKAAEKVFRWIISPEGQTVMTQQIKTNSARTDVPRVQGIAQRFKPLYADWERVYRDQDAYRALMNEYVRKGKGK